MAGDLLIHIPKTLYQNRYCDQDSFDLIISGVRTSSNFFEEKILSANIHKVKYTDLKLFASKSFTQEDQYRGCGEKVASGKSIWTVCDRNEEEWFKARSISLENDLITLPSIRTNFSVCSFMNSIFVFGGHYFYRRKRRDSWGSDISTDYYEYKSTSYEYNCKTGRWSIIKHMNSRRSNSSCAVFEGKIVVCGGEKDHYQDLLKSVEAYDYHNNEWSDLPSMVYERNYHNTLSIGNKMFVVSDRVRLKYGDLNCEVFDSSTRKFTILKVSTNVQIPHEIGYFPIISVGRKILLFLYADGKPFLIEYHVMSGHWTTAEVDFGNTRRIYFVSKIPQV